MIRPVALLVLPILGLLTACEEPQVSAVKARLVGTWVIESPEHGGFARRVLVLEPDGRARETVQTVAPSGAAQSGSREGEWFYDGVNFKRKYTYVDGEPLTNAHFIYETYELKSVTASQLVATSKVGRGEIRFNRDGAGGRQ